MSEYEKGFDVVLDVSMKSVVCGRQGWNKGLIINMTFPVAP